MSQCVPVDAELQAPQVADCVEALSNSHKLGEEAPRQTPQNATVISEASALGARSGPACACLPVSPSQSRGECDKDGHDSDRHHQRVSRHDALPRLFWALLAALDRRH
jgi:hypothetical protein